MRPAYNLQNGLTGHLKYLESTRSKMESLLSEGFLVNRDVDQVYAGLYLEAVTSFERLIENLFIGLLVGSLEVSSNRVFPRVSFKSSLVARQVVFGGRNFVDWIPYEYTETRAKAFFRNGLPFTSLEASEKNSILQLFRIRNTIAHKSNHSMRVFENEVLGSLPLMPRERTPIGFLRSTFRITPTQTRYENLINEMSAISAKLCM